jgi:hypothetical protein
VFDPNNLYYYILCAGTDTVEVINSSWVNFATISNIDLDGVQSIVFDLNSPSVYVSNANTNTLSYITGTTYVSTISVPNTPNKLFYRSFGLATDEIFILEELNGSISTFDTNTQQVNRTITGLGNIISIAYNYLYSTNYLIGTDGSTLQVLCADYSPLPPTPTPSVTSSSTPTPTPTITPTITPSISPSPLPPGSINNTTQTWGSSEVYSVMDEPGGSGKYLFGGGDGINESIGGTSTKVAIVTSTDLSPYSGVANTTTSWVTSTTTVMSMTPFTGNTVIISGAFNNWNNLGQDDIVVLEYPNYGLISSFTSPFTDDNVFGYRFTNKVYKTNDNGILLSTRQTVVEGTSSGWGSMRKLTSAGSDFAGFSQTGETNTISTGVIGSSYSSTSISDFAVKSDESQIVIVGNFTSYTETSTYTANNILALTSGGTVDLTFTGGTGTDGPINQIISVSTGGYLFGGMFTQYSGQSVNNLVRIDTNGNIDNSFSARTFSAVTRIDVVRETSSGKFIVLGKFSGYDGQTCNDFIIINTDGSLDTSYTYFTSSTLMLGTKYKLFTDVLETASTFIIVGSFYFINGNSREGVVEIVK